MISLSQSIRYGLPGFALAFSALPLYLLTPSLYAEQLGLNLGLVGLVLMSTRLIDAIADPLIGRQIDQSRSGLWPWLAAGLAVMVLSLALLVNPPVAWLKEHQSSATLGLLWMGLTALVLSLSNSVATLAHQSWAVGWTAQAKAQSRLIAGRETWALIGVITAAMIAAQQSGKWMAIVVTIAGLIGILLTFGIRHFGARPKSKATPHHPDAQQQSWRSLLEVQEFRRLLFAYSINALANAIPATLVLFFMKDLLGASHDHSSLLLGGYFVAAALSVAFWSWASQVLGIIKSWRIAMTIAVAAFIWTLSLGPGDTAGFALVCFATGFALGAELVCPPALLGLIIDRAGHRGRLEASYFGVWNLVIKLALAAAAGFALPALALLNYIPGQSDAQPSSLIALQWAYAGVPCLLKCIAIVFLGKLKSPEKI